MGYCSHLSTKIGFLPLRAEKALFSRAMTGHKGLFSARSEREEKTFFPPFLDFFQPIARKRFFSAHCRKAIFETCASETVNSVPRFYPIILERKKKPRLAEKHILSPSLRNYYFAHHGNNREVCKSPGQLPYFFVFRQLPVYTFPPKYHGCLFTVWQSRFKLT